MIDGKRGTKLERWKTQDWKTQDHETWGGIRELLRNADAARKENKTAELSQRRPRDAPNIWVTSKFLSPHYAPSYLSGNL